VADEDTRPTAPSRSPQPRQRIKVESTEVLHRTQPKLAARLEKAVDFAWVDAQETIHRNKCYDVRFNVSETYPQIVNLKELSVCPERKGIASASSAPDSAPPAGQGQSA
jgi:hypothetical protein